MLWMLCLPSASLFLLLLPCFPAQDGGGNEQSTDVISAWEGDSISITCPMNGSQNQVGMYLRAIRQHLNVMYFSKERNDCDFDNHFTCSKEGETVRITLHRLQQSDSEIYICSEIVKNNDYPKELYGKTTIVLVKANSSGALEQSPLSANPERGQSVSITCVLSSSRGADDFHLLRAHMQPGKVLSVSNLNVSWASPAFGSRLEYSREGNRAVITLHNLQEEDSDNYICAEEVKGSSLLSARGTMVLVKGNREVPTSKTSSNSTCEDIAIGMGFGILLALLVGGLIGWAIKSHRLKKQQYSQARRRNRPAPGREIIPLNG